MESADEISTQWMKQVIQNDTELSRIQKEYESKADHEKVLNYYSLRREVFREAAELTKQLPITIAAQSYINQHRGQMEMELKFYMFKKEVGEEIAKVVSKLDKIESKLKAQFPEFDKEQYSKTNTNGSKIDT
jgi:uncharacterized protein YfcZ (UPF0381/DUF406 family)